MRLYCLQACKLASPPLFPAFIYLVIANYIEVNIQTLEHHGHRESLCGLLVHRGDLRVRAESTIIPLPPSPQNCSSPPGFHHRPPGWHSPPSLGCLSLHDHFSARRGFGRTRVVGVACCAVLSALQDCIIVLAKSQTQSNEPGPCEWNTLRNALFGDVKQLVGRLLARFPPLDHQLLQLGLPPPSTTALCG